ncbi:TIGR04222 domain-containing membrane protein [Nonomuraea glycinis]|uniref:TIGR04222 domain-containing membrane protein n=1 Tax=Nonomuraea glycinis TaxID=2047744 RepID=UPI002E104455|nr:TIGR04222 domain-containing membrane protein [Nonomuraea glycinis]
MGVLVTLILVCAVLIAAVIANATSLKSRYARIRQAVDTGARELGAYEVAYLAGGSLRVVNTVLAVLIRTGLLRVSRGGLLHPVAGVDRPGDDLERAVLAAAGGRPGGTPAAEVRHEVGKSQEMGAVEHRLIATGLILPGAANGMARTRLGLLALLSALCLIVALVSLFCVLFLPEPAAMARGLLTVAAVALLVTGFVGLRTYGRLRRALRSLVTEAGRDRLRTARTSYRPGAPVTAASDISMPVALYGMGAMGDPATEAELNARNNSVPATGGCAGGTCGGSYDNTHSFGGGDFSSSSSSSGSSAGSCGGGSSSCGGGGGCGGGCGGG